MTEMRTPVIKPLLLDVGLVSSGQRVTSTLQIHPPSNAEVTAVLVQNDTGSFRVHQVVTYNVTQDPVDPGVPGAPATTTEVAVPHYHAAANGQVPLAVRTDQWVVVEVEAQPKGSSGTIVDGIVEIVGTGWVPVRRQLRATIK
jgi:hypothetical protein